MHASALLLLPVRPSVRADAPSPVFFFFYLTVIDERVGKAATCFFFYPRVDSNLRPVPWQNPSLASGVCTSHSYSVTRLYSRTIILSVWNYCTVDAAKKSKNKSSSCGCGFFFFPCVFLYERLHFSADVCGLTGFVKLLSKEKKKPDRELNQGLWVTERLVGVVLLLYIFDMETVLLQYS